MSKPRKKTIREVINLLEEYGLKVYGGNVNLETGQELEALRDFSADDVITYMYLMDKGKIWSNHD